MNSYYGRSIAASEGKFLLYLKSSFPLHYEESKVITLLGGWLALHVMA